MKVKRYLLNLFSHNNSNNLERRSFFYKMLAGTSIAALGLNQSAQAHKTEVEEETEERFPGDPPEHFMVFSFNHADHEYHQHVLGSVRAMIAKYDDNIDQVVVCFGKGIHALAKKSTAPCR